MSDSIEFLAQTNTFGSDAQCRWVTPSQSPLLADYGLILSLNRMDHHQFGVVRARFPQILACVEGAYKVFVNGRWKIARAGETLITPVGMPQAHRGMHSLCRLFAVQWINPLTWPDFSSLGHSGLHAIDFQTAIALFEQMYRESIGRGDAALLAAYAAAISRTIQVEVIGLHADRRVERLQEIVNADLAALWTIDGLADFVGVSGNHLRRLCLREIGRSPMAMVRDLRMRHAAGLLLHSDLPIKVIGDHVGYSSQYAFTRSFTKTFGRPPGAYRARTDASISDGA